MIDSIIILAGGDNSRWNGEKKYLKEVNGETVLGRTTRLCEEFRPDATLHIIGPQVKGKSHQDVFLKVYDKWSREGNTYLMFGDVSWMRGTLRKFLNEKPDHPILYGRPHDNLITGRKGEELFGGVIPVSWRDYMWKVNFDATILIPKSDWWTVADLMIWSESYRNRIFGLPDRFRDWVWFHVMKRRKEFYRSHFFYDVGESVTDDFDYPEDYMPYVEKCGPFIEREVAP